METYDELKERVKYLQRRRKDDRELFKEKQAMLQREINQLRAQVDGLERQAKYLKEELI